MCIGAGRAVVRPFGKQARDASLCAPIIKGRLDGSIDKRAPRSVSGRERAGYCARDRIACARAICDEMSALLDFCARVARGRERAADGRLRFVRVIAFLRVERAVTAGYLFACVCLTRAWVLLLILP